MGDAKTGMTGPSAKHQAHGAATWTVPIRLPKLLGAQVGKEGSQVVPFSGVVAFASEEQHVENANARCSAEADLTNLGEKGMVDMDSASSSAIHPPQPENYHIGIETDHRRRSLPGLPSHLNSLPRCRLHSVPEVYAEILTAQTAQLDCAVDLRNTSGRDISCVFAEGASARAAQEQASKLAIIGWPRGQASCVAGVAMLDWRESIAGKRLPC